MKIAFVTTADLTNSESWHLALWGLYCAAKKMASAFAQQGAEVIFVGPLTTCPVRASTLRKQRWYKKFGKIYSSYGEYYNMRSYAVQIEEKLANIQPDIIFCYDDGLALSFVKTDVPIVLYRDTLLIPLYQYYDYLKNVCFETKRKVKKMERRTLQKCSKIFFASDWAVDQACKTYHLSEKKFGMIPFGACVEQSVPIINMAEHIAAKPMRPIECVFFGIDWERKGGEKAVRIVRELNNRGYETRLTVIGCSPDIVSEDMSYIHVLGRLRQWEPAELAQIEQVLRKSHFLLMPVRAECFGHVFCEASAFGVPSIASKTGGVTTAIHEGVNGMLFPVETDVEVYCTALQNLIDDRKKYEELANSSYAEYLLRLNWKTGVQAVLQEMQVILS